MKFEDTYRYIAAWVTTRGWVEIGQTDFPRSMVRALDEEGTQLD